MVDALPGEADESVAAWLGAAVGTVAELAAAAPADDVAAPSVVEASIVDELAAALEAAASDVVEALGRHGSVLAGATDPVRLSKGRLDRLDRCERSALAEARDGADSGDPVALLRGIALDRFVAHQLRAGRVLDPLGDLRELLTVELDDATLGLIDAVGEERATEVVAPLATTVADAWSGIDPAWVPRTQSRATLVLADGAVVCSGVLDVELGGIHTGLPGVVVEVKSGRPFPSHPAETYLYALLCAVRDGRPPAVVVCWYPGSAPAALAVTTGVLETATLRLERGIRRWGELLAGDEPSERPGPWCSWCSDADVCPSSAVQGPTDHRGGSRD